MKQHPHIEKLSSDPKVHSYEWAPPEFGIIADYQRTVASQIQSDPGEDRKIQGKSYKDYFIDGLIAEINEVVFEEDREEPDYDRFYQLLLGPHYKSNEPYVTPTAQTRHSKEFGDTGWYLANLFTEAGLDARQAVLAGIQKYQLDAVSNPTSNPFDYSETGEPHRSIFETLMPGLFAIQALTALRDACDNFRPTYYHKTHGSQLLRQQTELLILGGHALVTMSQASQGVFDQTMDGVFLSNIAKINKRIADGTVFNKTGGDDR